LEKQYSKKKSNYQYRIDATGGAVGGQRFRRISGSFAVWSWSIKVGVWVIGVGVLVFRVGVLGQNGSVLGGVRVLGRLSPVDGPELIEFMELAESGRIVNWALRSSGAGPSIRQGRQCSRYTLAYNTLIFRPGDVYRRCIAGVWQAGRRLVAGRWQGWNMVGVWLDYSWGIVGVTGCSGALERRKSPAGMDLFVARTGQLRRRVLQNGLEDSIVRREANSGSLGRM
jgi:hypothetical protein